MEMDREKQIYVAAALLAVMMFTVGMSVLFGGEVERLPLRHQAVPAPAETVTRQLRYTTEYYRALLKEDAKKFGVVAPDPGDFAKPFPYHVEFTGRHRLLPRRGGGLETEHLALNLTITKEWAQAPGGGFTTDHAILRIANRTDSYLAYRVTTEPTDARRCLNKSETPHNAIALTPKEEVARTECTVDSSTAIYVTKVEVIELPPLAYHYVCRLRPVVLLLDERTSAGHAAGRRRPCDPIAWAEIKAGAEAKEVTWRDVVDFYARHSCDDYTFFRGYHYREHDAGPLPVVPPPRRR